MLVAIKEAINIVWNFFLIQKLSPPLEQLVELNALNRNSSKGSSAETV
jgi:hypothetical protein